MRLIPFALLLLACNRDKTNIDDTGTPIWGLTIRPENTSCKAPDRPVNTASVTFERLFSAIDLKTPTGAWHFGVNPRSTHKEAVATFVRDMLSDDINVYWFKLRPYVPTLTISR